VVRECRADREAAMEAMADAMVTMEPVGPGDTMVSIESLVHDAPVRSAGSGLTRHPEREHQRERGDDSERPLHHGDASLSPALAMPPDCRRFS
ncbi:MAG TPA: hypothetical protein VKN16_19785, partial [Methylomirabilota bacterium]|nr:hypothetical protein [Methylomirabilota bacterium]